MQEIAIQRQQLSVENLRTQWERMRALHERKLIDEDSFVTATNNLEIAEVDIRSGREQLEQARAQLEQQQDRLAKTSVYSPIDGKVTTLDIKVGETAISSSTNIPGSSLMTIANPASIHTEVNVDEADIANVTIGQHARVFAIAYPDQPVDGVVDSIARVREDRRRSAGSELRDQDPVARSREDHAAPGHDLPRRDLHGHEDRRGRRADPGDPGRGGPHGGRDASRRVRGPRRSRARRSPSRSACRTTRIQEIVSGLTAGDEIITGPDRVLRALEDGDRVVVEQRKDNGGRQSGPAIVVD